MSSPIKNRKRSAASCEDESMPCSSSSLSRQHSTPAAPKRRRFTIDELLASPFHDVVDDDEPMDVQDENEELDINRYVREIGTDKHVNKKFKNGVFETTFSIEALPPNPEHLLHSIFQKCINAAIVVLYDRFGVLPDQLGGTVFSELLDEPVWVPLRPIHGDTADNILNRFLTVIQSRDREGKGNVLGEPFTVRIDAICAKALPTVREIRGSGGRTHGGIDQSHLNPVHHNINYNACIIVDRYMARPYCLFYSMILAKQHRLLERRAFYYYYHDQWRQQREDVHQLLQATQIPILQDDYDAMVYGPMVIDYWNQIHAADGLRFKLFVFNEIGHFKPDFVYGEDKFNIAITILHVKDHFHGIRKAGSMLRHNNKYCFDCLTPYRKDSEHKGSCKARCRYCGRVGEGRPCESEPGYRSKCAGCNRVYVNLDCFQQHLAHECARNKQCDACGCIWNVKKNTENGRRGHVCGERKCKLCLEWHKPEQYCFIKPIKPKRYTPYRIVVFDFESTQHQSVSAEHPERKKHNVNFVAAHVLCTHCMRNGRWRLPMGQLACYICGDARTITFSVRTHHTQVDRKEVYAEPLDQFVNWLIYELPAQYKTIAFSHFGGRYDIVLAFHSIMETGKVPQMIKRGNKLYELRIPKTNRVRRGRTIETCEVLFRDSYNLIPIALGRLTKAFGLNIPDKPYFPHLANIPENYDRVLDEYPPKWAFLYKGMSPENQRMFDPWYEQVRHNPFNLSEQLAEYCLNDVEILTEALMSFREEFFKISKPKNGPQWFKGIDVLHDAMTIAGACKKHFLLNHLPPNHIGIVPHRGYDHADNQSKVALQYLDYYGEIHGVEVQTALSEEGEKRVGRYRLDGYIKEEDKGIEVNGCTFHAHECKFDDEGYDLPSGKTVGKTRQLDAARLKYLRASLRGGVEVIWECQIRAQLKRDKRMRQVFKRFRDEGPIRLREAFFGGRTAPLRLHYEPPQRWKMGYLDFCSLYPSTTASTAYPVGHPTRVVIKKGKQAVNWTRPEDIPLNGILKVFVVPPKTTPIPSLPAKFDDRLLFPLCRACALQYPEGGVIPNYKCQHKDDFERGWVATLTSIELAAALEEDGGFRVTRFYRALEYEKWDDKLFKGYVSEMMEGKIHASGFPEGVDTEEKQMEFIEENFARFGIKIDPAKMDVNKALRELLKLMNNNLWARFSLRSDLSKTHLTNCPAELRKYLDDRSLHVDRLDELNEDLMMLTYGQIDEFVDDHNFANVVISLWTTAAARVRLLREMRKLVKAGGVLLYTDTDSLIFAYREADGCPLQTGWHLGDLQPEYADYDIVEFVSSGCKAYGLRMVHKETGKELIILRLRGITLSGDIAKKLHFESFKQCVMAFAEWADSVSDEEIEIIGEKIARNEDDWTINLQYDHFVQPDVRTGTVVTKPIKKKYKPVILKGIVTNGKIIKDFGATD